MDKPAIIYAQSSQDPIHNLEHEIAMLEAELVASETRLNAFENIIRAQLSHKIIQIRDLTTLYKSQKQAKKMKRLEQKKRGKNYKEPTGLVKSNNSPNTSSKPEDQQELKRLYKEAIVHVHPDKFADDEDGKANDLTIQLIDIYKSGDLEKLILFHDHIVSGNAMSHVPFKSESITNPKAMLVFLKKKREEVLANLEEIRQSYTFTVLNTYQDPNIFIDELSVQFDQRIAQLQKRVR